MEFYGLDKNRNPLKLFTLSLLFNVFILSLNIISGTIKFEVSDDFIMMATVSGAYNGIPSKYIMFMNPLIGILISGLYNCIPSINWYVWLQLIMICISFSIILYIGLKMNNKFIIFCMLIFNLIASIDMYQLMQFTKTATLIISTGFFVFLYDINIQESSINVWTTVLFVICGFLIRSQCFYLTAFIFSIVFLINWMLKQSFIFSKKNRIIKYVLVIFSILCCVLVFKNYFISHNPEYKQYVQYGKIRSQLIDYPLPEYEFIKDELTDINISENDYKCISTWNLCDSEYFTKNKLNSILQIVQKYRSNEFNIKSMLKNMYHRKYWEYLIVWSCIVISISIFIIDYRRIWQVMIIGFTCLALLMYFEYLQRVVYRVEFSIIMTCALALISLLIIKPPQNTIPCNRIGIVLIVILIALRALLLLPMSCDSVWNSMFYSWVNDIHKYRLKIESKSIKDLNEYMNTNSHYYLMDFNTTIQSYYLAYDPLKSLDRDYFKNKMYIYGVDFLSPEQVIYYRHKSIINPIKSLMDPNTYYICNDTSVLETFIKEHYDKNFYFKKVKTLNGFDIYKSELRGVI